MISAARDALEKLGVTNVGQFAGLPVEGIEKRFGPEVYRLHRLASGGVRVPLQPEQPSPPAMQRQILEKKLDFYVIDAYGIAAETGMGRRINTVMQPCFFRLAGVMPVA